MLSFEVTPEGFRREGLSGDTGPCRLVPTPPQPSCRTPPCFNVACKAVLRYRAVVELPPGVDRIWPSCYFKQQRMGSRGHHEGGRRRMDQYEPAPTHDFEGSPANAVGFTMRPAGFRRFEIEFYDLPGWRSRYWDGRLNAVSPVWLPLDWRYMYRAYLGPRPSGLGDEDYRYVRVEMEAAALPAPAITGRQSVETPRAWRDFQRELEGLRPESFSNALAAQAVP